MAQKYKIIYNHKNVKVKNFWKPDLKFELKRAHL